MSVLDELFGDTTPVTNNNHTNNKMQQDPSSSSYPQQLGHYSPQIHHEEPEQVEERFFNNDQKKNIIKTNNNSNIIISIKAQRRQQELKLMRQNILSRLSSSFPSSIVSSMPKSSQNQNSSSSSSSSISAQIQRQQELSSLICIPSPAQVWHWIAHQGRFAEALNALDTLTTLRRAEWEEQQLQRCRGNNNDNSSSSSSSIIADDDLLEEAIEHRDKMRLLRAETLALHAATSFAQEFPVVALQPFLSENHCEDARKQIVVKLRERLMMTSTTGVSASASASSDTQHQQSKSTSNNNNNRNFVVFEHQSWNMVMEEDRRVLRQELNYAVEALEALCTTQAHSIQELILVSALIQLNRAVYYLCASILPLKNSRRFNNTKDDEKSEENNNNKDSSSTSDSSDSDSEDEDESDETSTLDHTLLAASLLLERPSWHSLAAFNRKTLLTMAKRNQQAKVGASSDHDVETSTSSKTSSSSKNTTPAGGKNNNKKSISSSSSSNKKNAVIINKIASSVQRCMRICQKLKTGGKLEDARVLVSASVMLAELQSALDVALPEALQQQQQQHPEQKKDKEDLSSSSSIMKYKIVKNEELPSGTKCAISGAPFKPQNGDIAIKIFVPRVVKNDDGEKSGGERRETVVLRFDRARATETSVSTSSSGKKRKTNVEEMIVDFDTWMFFEKYCMQK